MSSELMEYEKSRAVASYYSYLVDNRKAEVNGIIISLEFIIINCQPVIAELIMQDMSCHPRRSQNPIRDIEEVIKHSAYRMIRDAMETPCAE